jgi:hypothetical protein
MKKHKTPSKCKCGHPWLEHHLSCLMNPNWPSECHDYGICGGLGGGECEWTQVNGERIREDEPECLCSYYMNKKTGKSCGQAEGIPNDKGAK